MTAVATTWPGELDEVVADDRSGVHGAVVRLERTIDRAARNGGPFSPASSARFDRTESFPAAAMAVLDDFGLHRWFVPARHGGRFSMPAIVQLLRVVSRHDLTVAIAYGKTFLGSAPTWVAGSHEQGAQLAQALATPSLVTWALTERGHGSDLLSGEVTVTAVEEGWQLDGEKWLINNAARAPLVCLLARVPGVEGPRSLSLLLVRKADLAASSVRNLPAERLHGIRGADISGLTFDAAVAPPDALIGAPGSGLETVLRTMQLTRTACVSLSLGAADEALRLVSAFVRSRRAHGHRLIELPAVRADLGIGFADLLAAEAVSHVAARSAHLLPAEMSVVAAVAKAFVPSLGEEIISRSARILGARSVLTEEFADGSFAKLHRDHRIVSIFDGNTVVNRIVLANQFRSLAGAFETAVGRGPARGAASSGAADDALLARVADLDGPVPELEVQRLVLLSRSGCSLVQGLPRSLDEVRGLAEPGAAGAELARIATRLGAAVEVVMAQLAGAPLPSRNVPAATFRLAARFEVCFAAAAAVRIWLHNRAARGADPLWHEALWLRAVLARLLLRLDPADPAAVAVLDRTSMLLADHLVEQGAAGRIPGLTTSGARDPEEIR